MNLFVLRYNLVVNFLILHFLVNVKKKQAPENLEEDATNKSFIEGVSVKLFYDSTDYFSFFMFLLFYSSNVLLFCCYTVILDYCSTALFFFYFSTVLLFYGPTVLLFFFLFKMSTLQLFYFSIVLLFYGPTVLLFFCFKCLLYNFSTFLLLYCSTVPFIVDHCSTVPFIVNPFQWDWVETIFNPSGGTF